jgi:hypothetical protein
LQPNLTTLADTFPEEVSVHHELLLTVWFKIGCKKFDMMCWVQVCGA